MALKPYKIGLCIYNLFMHNAHYTTIGLLLEKLKKKFMAFCFVDTWIKCLRQHVSDVYFMWLCYKGCSQLVMALREMREWRVPLNMIYQNSSRKLLWTWKHNGLHQKAFTPSLKDLKNELHLKLWPWQSGYGSNHVCIQLILSYDFDS